MKKRILTVFLTITMIISTIPCFGINVFAKTKYVSRSTSELGVNFIEAFEGYFQYAYWDYEHYTIGYGTTCEKDEYPAGISEPFAHKLLKQKLPSYEKGLNSFLKNNDIYVTQNQYDALMSFTYNFGAYVWNREPTIAKYLKKGIEKYTDKQIADAFGLWVNAGGQKLPGLVERRKAEAEFFCTDDFAFTDELYVTTASVTLRKGAGTSYASVGSLSRGDIVKVTDKKYIGTGSWGKTTYKKQDVWFSLDYAKYANIETDSAKLISTNLYKAENVNGGIKLQWKTVIGADKYKIFRKAEGDSKYNLFKTITNNKTVSFTDKSVSASKEYRYYIITSKGEKDAARSAIVYIKYVKAPSLKSLSRISNGFTLTWSKQSGANGYHILRRAADDDTYTKIASVSSSSTSYTDTKAVGGVKYYYTIKSYNSYGLSGAPAGKSGIYLATPSIKSSTNTDKSITINWSKSLGADGYYIYRKTSGTSSTKLIATIKSGATVKYTDNSVSASKSYTYTIKAYSKAVDSYTSSAFNTKLYKPPVITSVKSTDNSILIKWKKASGADKYNIYRKEESGNYKKIASVSGIEYSDKSVSSGKKYYYKISSTAGGCKESYKSETKSSVFFGKTKIKSSVSTAKGVKISWNKINSAKSYSVYKYENKKYTLLKTVNSTSFTDETLGKATSRYYSVKVNYSNGKSSYSDKFKAYKLTKPKLKVKSTSKGLLLSWNKIKNAKGIIIYRKDPGQSKYKLYTKQTNYEKNTFENSTAVKGKKYSYYIKVIRGNCTSENSNSVNKKR